MTTAERFVLDIMATVDHDWSKSEVDVLEFVVDTRAVEDARKLEVFDELLNTARRLCVYNDVVGSAGHLKLTLDLKDVVGAIDSPKAEGREA